MPILGGGRRVPPLPILQRIEEEGVVIDNWLLVDQGVLSGRRKREQLLSAGPYPLPQG